MPRPDSETLLIAALAHFGNRAPATVLDLGTGPGTLLLAALDEWPARGIGVDRSAQALAYATSNATALGMAHRTAFVRGDWAAAIDARFDLVLANPPYIGTDEPLPDEVRRHEPGSALFAGADGLDDYRLLAGQLARLIAPGGCAAVEIGHTQAPAVAALFARPASTASSIAIWGSATAAFSSRPAPPVERWHDHPHISLVGTPSRQLLVGPGQAPSTITRGRRTVTRILSSSGRRMGGGRDRLQRRPKGTPRTQRMAPFDRASGPKGRIGFEDHYSDHGTSA